MWYPLYFYWGSVEKILSPNSQAPCVQQPLVIFKDIADGKTGDDLDDIEVISSKEAAKFPIMASITLFSIYLLYKYFADKMYYFVTGYFFLLGVAAVTGKNRVGYL